MAKMHRMKFVYMCRPFCMIKQKGKKAANRISKELKSSESPFLSFVSLIRHDCTLRWANLLVMHNYG